MSACMLAGLALAGVSGQTESSRSSTFVEADGIGLHYLDWRGQGEPVVFLQASAHPRQLSTTGPLAFATASVCTR